MVIRIHPHARIRGTLMVDLVVGMGILVLAIMPLAYSVRTENQLFRATYQRALAMEMVDGEMEILAAGEWQSFPEGTNTYAVRGRALANLPPGQFQLARAGKHLRLTWTAEEKHGIGTIVREVTFP